MAFDQDPTYGPAIDNMYLSMGLPPLGAQGQMGAGQNYLNYLQGRMPQTNTAMQNPMLGGMASPSLPQTDELSRLMPSHPRLGGALDNAALAMSMVPTGMTIGENIKNVAGAMTELPYARLQHQYQMLQPGQEFAAKQAQIADIQSQSAMRNMQAQYYGGKNLTAEQVAQMKATADVQAQTQRGAAAAALREANMNAQPMIRPAEADDPNGRYKKGEPIMGYLQHGMDETTGKITETFQPSGETADTYRQQGGISSTGAVSRGQNSYAAGGSPSSRAAAFAQLPVEQGGLGLNPIQANQLVQDQGVQAAMKKFFGENMQPTPKDLADQQLKDMDTSDKKLYADQMDQLKKQLGVKGYADAAIAGYSGEPADWNKEVQAKIDTLQQHTVQYNKIPKMDRLKLGGWQGYLQQQQQPATSTGNWNAKTGRYE